MTEDRSGLWAQPLKNREALVTLSPDLAQAVVTEPMPYTIEVERGMTETVRLTRTAVYLRQDESWQYAPFPDDQGFWGQWQTKERGIVTLYFAERDAKFGRRLAADLDLITEQFCQQMICPTDIEIKIRLARDTVVIENLLNINQLYISNLSSRSTINLDLPSPTLVGLPVDDAAYEALYQGYAGWLAAYLTTRLGEPDLNVHEDASLLASLDLKMPSPPGYYPITRTPDPPPIPLPEQDLYLLCTGSENQIRLMALPARQRDLG